MNKKLLALLLAILMVAMSAVAMADTIGISINITKTYTSTGTTYPSETLNFTATCESYTDATGTTKELTEDITLSGSQTTTGVSSYPNISLSASGVTVPEAGTYHFVASETEPTTKTQGVTYDNKDISFDVLIGYAQNADGTFASGLSVLGFAPTTKNDDQEKIGGFTNAYEMSDSSSTLTITKKITGNAAVTSDEFNVVLTMTAAANSAFDSSFTSINVGNGTAAVTLADNNTKATATVKVTNNSSLVITGIPVGATVAVAETNKVGKNDLDSYTASYELDNASVSTVSFANTAAHTVAITNTRNAEVPTGVTTDSMPYILLLAFVAILAVAFVAKKRTVKE